MKRLHVIPEKCRCACYIFPEDMLRTSLRIATFTNADISIQRKYVSQTASMTLSHLNDFLCFDKFLVTKRGLVIYYSSHHHLSNNQFVLHVLGSRLSPQGGQLILKYNIKGRLFGIRSFGYNKSKIKMYEIAFFIA